MTNGSTVNPSEVGWQFVPQYYTFVNNQPNLLHCFYTKASTFSHGTEGEDGKPCYGQQVRVVLKVSHYACSLGMTRISFSITAHTIVHLETRVMKLECQLAYQCQRRASSQNLTLHYSEA